MTAPGPYPRQGEVWDVDLEPTLGHEQRGRARPSLIVSVDRLNAARWVILIVPMTGSLRALPTRVRVPAGEGGLTMESDILCEQLRAIDMGRLGQYRGSVTPETLRAVSTMIRRLTEV